MLVNFSPKSIIFANYMQRLQFSKNWFLFIDTEWEYVDYVRPGYVFSLKSNVYSDDVNEADESKTMSINWLQVMTRNCRDSSAKLLPHRRHATGVEFGRVQSSVGDVQAPLVASTVYSMCVCVCVGM